MTHLRTSILGIALFTSVASFAATEESGDEIAPPGMVRVELSEVRPPKPPEHDFQLKDYSERRGKWGGQFGFGINTYAPTSYSPAFVSESFSSVYNTFASTPLLEAQGVVKRNFDWGAVGIEFAFGAYSNSAKGSSGIQSTLNLTQYRIGIIYIDEMMMRKRYVSPYASIGGYLTQFNESESAVTFQGNTEFAPYITVGAQFSLDWMEPKAARLAYDAGAVQSTYLYAEVRKYFASFNPTDPDFSSSFAPGLGVRIEF
jgi:hypothetical protein